VTTDDGDVERDGGDPSMEEWTEAAEDNVRKEVDKKAKKSRWRRRPGRRLMRRRRRRSRGR
jgi:hypothetical protein